MLPYENLVQILEDSAVRFKDRPIYGTKNKKGSYEWVTYGEFKIMVDQTRAGLWQLGLRPGNKVAIIAANSLEWAVAAYATYGLGGQFVAMYENQSVSDWKYILKDCGAKILFVSTHAIFAKTKDLMSELSTLKNIINIQNTAISDDSSFERLKSVGAQHPVTPVFPQKNDPMGLIYTSGTTGNPKGVILSHENVLCNLRAIDKVFDFSENDVSLCFLPWAHIFGQVAEVHLLIARGYSAGFAEGVNTIVQNLAEVKPTLLFSVPRIFNRIYDGVQEKMKNSPLPIRLLFEKAMKLATRKKAGEELSLTEEVVLTLADKIIFKKIRGRFGGRLRYALSGASALNPDVARFIDNLNIQVYEGYGLSETAPMIAVNSPGHRIIGSVGKAIPEVKIVIDRSVTSGGEEGEIINYGPNIMIGYHNQPEETAKVMTADGGFRTGDLGRLDKDGFLFITGRIKEQYKLENGKYVVPSPLEEELKLSPFITQAFLFGDNKPYNVVVVSVDMARIRTFAKQNEISGDDKSLLEHKAIKALMQEELENNQKNFKGYERPKKFALVADEWNVDNGLLTPTLKVKRKQVLAKYQGLIEGLYH